MHKEKHCTLCLPCLKGGGPAYAGGGIQTLAYKFSLYVDINSVQIRVCYYYKNHIYKPPLPIRIHYCCAVTLGTGGCRWRDTYPCL